MSLAQREIRKGMTVLITDIVFAVIGRVARGEGVPPLRREAILASLSGGAVSPWPEVQGQDALATKNKGKMPSPPAGEGRFLGHGLKGPLRRFAGTT
jgi:hypothetical protein